MEGWPVFDLFDEPAAPPNLDEIARLRWRPGMSSLVRRPAGSNSALPPRGIPQVEQPAQSPPKGQPGSGCGGRGVSQSERAVAASRPSTSPTAFRCQPSATQEILQTADDFAAAHAIDFRPFYELLTEMARSTPDGEGRQKRGHPWPARTSHGQQPSAKNGRIPRLFRDNHWAGDYCPQASWRRERNCRQTLSFLFFNNLE